MVDRADDGGGSVGTDPPSMARPATPLAILAGIAVSLFPSPGTERRLETILQRLSAILACDLLATHTLEDGALRLEETAALDPALAKSFIRLPLDDQRCGQSVASPRFHCSRGEALSLHPCGASLWALGLRAFASVPLLGEGQQLGTLSAGSRREEAFGDEALELLRHVGDLLAAARARDVIDGQNRENESLLRLCLDNASDAIFLHDLEGNIVDVNREACDKLGYSREELIGKSPLDIDPQIRAEDFPAILARLDRGELVGLETTHRRSDGNTFPVELRMRRFWRGGRGYGIALVRDITEEKRAEAARRKLEEELRQAHKMEAIGRLAGGIAHDFNNLLTVINGSCDIVLEEIDPHTQMAVDIAAARDAGRRAAELTRQLLAFSRKQMLDPVLVDLNTIVAHTEKLLRRLIGANIAMTTVLAPALWRTRVDPGQIEQVLLNLVLNSRDAMPDGGKITLETWNEQVSPESAARTSGGKPGPHVVLAVRDTGHGMTEEVKAKVFEPFFTTKAVGKGTGLGLATVYGIVTQSDGYLRLDSEVGRGTECQIFFPACDDSSAQAQVAKPDVVSPGTETILLAEDEDAVRRLIQRILEKKGYRVLTGTNGADALHVARHHAGPIALLLTDVVMPEMGGRELADTLRRERPGLPVLFMSGYNDDAVLHQNVHGSTDAFLQKPFLPDDLVSHIRDAIDESSRTARAKP